MSQLEDSPAALLERFRENLLDKMEQIEDDPIATSLVLAVIMIVGAAEDTAAQMEDEDGAD